MMVRLDCVYKKQKCVIIRHFIRKPYGDGTKQEDYEYSFTVSLDAKTLSQEEALDFLQRTLPSDISRFYLLMQNSLIIMSNLSKKTTTM